MVNIMNIIKRLQKEFNYTTDLIIKDVNGIKIIYLESLCDSNKINEFVLKNLTRTNIITNLKSKLAGPNTQEVPKYDLISYYLENGFTIIKGIKIYAVETRGNLFRSVEKPSVEPSIYGPKDSFNESIQTNLGLIKRRIKSNNLINDDYFIGRISNTKLSVLYMKGITDNNLVNKLESKLSNIDVDSILSIGNIHQYLVNESHTALPTIQETERPDVAVNALLEGKIVIICDSAPFAIITPSFLADFINPVSDIYGKKNSVNFLKVLRMFCFITTITLPALYVALLNFNQESIPVNLLANFARQRSGVPFPSALEAIIMLITCGILRECDLIFPAAYGSSISIVGALILGDAAVKANIFSPIMIIIGSFTFITSMIFSDINMVNSIRLYRLGYLFLATTLGLYGLYIASSLFIMHICSLNVLGKPYTAPLAPFDKVYYMKTLFKAPIKQDKNRSSILVKKNLFKG
jgi:spore germination protein KA